MFLCTSPVDIKGEDIRVNFFMESVSNKYFFQDIDGFKINSGDYLDEVKAILPSNWEISRSGIYIYCQNRDAFDIPIQGWKIHVSSNIYNGNAILKIVSELAKEENFPFKFLGDKALHSITIQKPYPRSQSGKFITIYPKDTNHFIKVIEELYQKMKGMDGPYVLTDKRYKDCKVLYYRYGGFVPIKIDGSTNHYIFNKDGDLILDERKPYYMKPDFIDDPFNYEVQEDNSVNNLFNQYDNITPLRFSNSGGVYNAICRKTGKEVIVKEARPYTCMSLPDKMDAVDYRKNEKTC